MFSCFVRKTRRKIKKRETRSRRKIEKVPVKIAGIIETLKRIETKILARPTVTKKGITKETEIIEIIIGITNETINARKIDTMIDTMIGIGIDGKTGTEMIKKIQEAKGIKITTRRVTNSVIKNLSTKMNPRKKQGRKAMIKVCFVTDNSFFPSQHLSYEKKLIFV